MNIQLNGGTVDIQSPPLTSLLTVLREELNVTSPKRGCDQGGCGACTVLVNGTPRRTCLTPVAAVDGADITTIEGLGDSENLTAVQQSFLHHYAAQCGFCTPAMIIAATAYLDGDGSAKPEAIQEALKGHVCRCTGYQKIITAVSAAATQTEFDLTSMSASPNTVILPGGDA
jgi:aerobic-type carbon monoxide dehydrogenase small subunit (CoxS/CutS family)